jgi:hypothetical protein
MRLHTHTHTRARACTHALRAETRRPAHLHTHVRNDVIILKLTDSDTLLMATYFTPVYIIAAGVLQKRLSSFGRF